MPRTLPPPLLSALLCAALGAGAGCGGASCGGEGSWQEVRDMIRARFPEVRQVSAVDLRARLAAGEAVVLLDVRQPQEYRVSHLAGAVRVDPDAEMPELPPGVGPDTPIVAYCSVGYRSSALVQRLMARGYRDAANLEGSIFEWANQGYPVVRGGVEVRQVHPYDERWGRWLAAELHAYEPR